jgi:predicted dehydrogenase/nucleoside-diphosphate-sugar epimerase
LSTAIERQTAQTPPPSASAPSGPSRRGAALRVAVVGAGFIADFHLEILRAIEGVELVAVCDADAARAQASAARHRVPRAVRSLAELQGVADIAHVLVPPTLHFSVAKELLERGLGVFVEKPLALSSADARALQALARERGLTLGVNHNALHHPSFAALLERVRSGAIGRVEHVRATLSVPLRQLDAGDTSHWMFAAPRNIVFEQGPHPFAQIHALVGRVERAQTTLLQSRELNPGQHFHERWLIAAQAERGTAELYLAFGQSFQRSTIEVLGSDGSLEADLLHGGLSGEQKTKYLDFWNSFLAQWRRGRAFRLAGLRGLFFYARQTLGLGRREDAFFAGMRGSIESFYGALRGIPSARPHDDPAGALAVVEWCEAATSSLGSAREEKRVLPEAMDVRPGEVVVLGGSGFIGSKTVERLLERGLPVTCTLRRGHHLPAILQEGSRAGRFAQPLRILRASLEDPSALAQALRGASCVVHLATGGGADWPSIERSMVRGTEQVGEICLAERVERLIYVSSIAALYLGADAGESADDGAPTDDQPERRSLYARGKIAAERVLLRLFREKNLPVTIVRPGVVLGPGTPMQHSGLGLWVRDNHCVGWGRGRTNLPVVLVDDVADAICRLIEHKGQDLDGRALNLAAAPGLCAAEIVEELARASGRALHFHARPLLLSQSMEIGKWLVKVAGRRPGAEFPSLRDLKSRALVPRIPSTTARTVLGWKPVEDRKAFLERAVNGYAPRRGP